MRGVDLADLPAPRKTFGECLPLGESFELGYGLGRDGCCAVGMAALGMRLSASLSFCWLAGWCEGFSHVFIKEVGRGLLTGGARVCGVLEGREESCEDL